MRMFPLYLTTRYYEFVDLNSFSFAYRTFRSITIIEEVRQGGSLVEFEVKYEEDCEQPVVLLEVHNLVPPQGHHRSVVIASCLSQDSTMIIDR